MKCTDKECPKHTHCGRFMPEKEPGQEYFEKSPLWKETNECNFQTPGGARPLKEFIEEAHDAAVERLADIKSSLSN